MSFNSEQIINEIIDCIRNTVKEIVIQFPHCHPWDEENNGTSWLINEIGIAVDFLEIINPSKTYRLLNMYKSVNILTEDMKLFSESELKFIRFFIINLGGTSHHNNRIFELRNETASDIVEFFEYKGYKMMSG